MALALPAPVLALSLDPAHSLRDVLKPQAANRNPEIRDFRERQAGRPADDSDAFISYT